MSKNYVDKGGKRVGISLYERQVIEVRIRGKWSFRKIGRYLSRDHTVIKREVDRNRRLDGKYDAKYAQRLADNRARRTNTKILNGNVYLRRHVIKQIRDEHLSPEQIAGRLKVKPPLELVGVSISHECIYQWIYTDAKWLYKYLRKKKRPKRTKWYSRKKRAKTTIIGRVSIHDRPEIIDSRQRVGDWESDSMKFNKQKTALSVQYERKTMLVRLHQVANLGKDETYRALTESIDSLPQYLFNSITFDNGTEGARHHDVKREYNINTYFCDPYKSWQKGGVENINGLIRQYLPRSTELGTITDEQIQKIQEKLNNRPRKKLGFLTPNELIQREMYGSGGA